jgi:hypothetical protein
MPDHRGDLWIANTVSDPTRLVNRLVMEVPV